MKEQFGNKPESQELSPEAQLLKGQLAEFAGLTTNEREKALVELYDLVHKKGGDKEPIIDKEIIAELADKKFQPYVEDAVQSTLETKFERSNGELVDPFEGAFTAVAIDLKGNILGGLANPVGEVYRKYGENLFPYALMKAVLRLHLELAKRNGGLDSEKNIDYIKELLPEKLIFLGESMGWPTVGTVEIGNIIIGASGCELKHDYRNGLAPGMVKDGTVDFLAGSADEIFADLIARYLEDNSRSKSAKEPENYSWLRRAH